MTDIPKLSLVVDSMALSTDGMVEKDGILSVPVTLAREMVLDYGGLKVLKPASELEAAVPFMDRLPVTREHPEAGIVTDRDQVLGFMRDPLFENDELKGILDISNTTLIADVKDGKVKEVSGGFFCHLDHTPGELNGVAYDAVQRSIFMNHAAVVDAGRCGIADGCGLNLDSKNEIDSPANLVGKLDTAIGMATNEYNSTLKDLLVEIREMVTTGTGDSKTEDDSKTAEEALRTERDALKEELESIVKIDKDAIIKELTELQDAKKAEDLEKLELDALKKELETVRELRSERLSFDATEDASSAVDKAYGM